MRRLPQLGEGLGAQPALDADTRAGGIRRVARQQQPLGLVPADAVARRVVGVQFVDLGLAEVQPEAVTLEGQRALARDDDAVGSADVVAEPEEDSLEGASVRGGAVEEERDARPGLSESPGSHEVHDGRRGHPGHGGLQRLVRRRKDDVVEEEHQDRGGRGGAEHRAVEGGGPDAAGAQGRELRIRVEAADPDEDAEQERHRKRQDDDPWKRQGHQPRDLRERRAPADREIREQQNRPDQENERVGREPQEEGRPDFPDHRLRDQRRPHGVDSAEGGGPCKGGTRKAAPAGPDIVLYIIYLIGRYEWAATGAIEAAPHGISRSPSSAPAAPRSTPRGDGHRSRPGRPGPRDPRAGRPRRFSRGAPGACPLAS